MILFLDAFTGVRSMVKTEGMASLWRGLFPTLLRDVPHSAIYWMMYEELKRKLEINTQTTHIQQFQYSFIAGATSGTVSKKRRSIQIGDTQL